MSSVAFRVEDYGKKALGSKYTLLHKAEGLAVLTACRNNQRAAESTTGISAKTLRRWQIEATQNDTLAAVAAVKKGELAEKIESLMDGMLAAIAKDVVNATIKDVPAFCQLFDRWFMLHHGVEAFEYARQMTRRNVA